ncbi:MAG TPA: TonB-dependent receptor [Bryobacteraceae bacterium]|nr:TonB-dependent receptor [Bryobacteraceae bacterium]
MFRQKFAVLAAIVLAACLPIHPQDAKPWAGVLRDNAGAGIANAAVNLRSGGANSTAKTDASGRFTFPAVAAGEYSVSVELNRTSALLPRKINLPWTGLEAVLQLSSDGTLSLIEDPGARQSTGGQQLSNKAVSSLPLNKRDFSQLLLLAAGTMTDTNGAANFTQQFAVNGQRGTAAVFAMDGADSTDPEMGGATFTNLNVDAVQEIRSSSGWMPAEIGRGAAGFTDIITRSGTNSEHGSAFEFLRNSALDARNFFDQRSVADPRRIPPFIRNEFGITNGGPVVIPRLYNGRDKTYYFVEYQGFRQVLSATEILPVPSVDERKGLDKTAFPGDTLVVPVNPQIQKLIDRYPLPNDLQGPYGARTYATSSKVTTVSDQFSARLDHRISDKSQLFARFTFENTVGPTTNPSQTALDPLFAVEFTDQQRNAAISYTRTQSPSLTMQSSLSFTRATPGFPTLDRTDPALTFGDGLYEAFNAAAGSVTAWFGNLGQFRQTFSWTHGKHSFQAGGEARLNRDTSLFGIDPNGQYLFGGGAAYSPVAIRSLSGAHNIPIGALLPDALTGLLTASAFSYTTAVAPLLFPQGARIGDAGIHRDAYNLYVQDSWKITERLLLNYGLRYEIESRIREKNNQTSAPVLGGNALLGSTLLINPKPPYKLDKNGWGPRVALEWRAAPNTLLRAGAGVTTLLVNLYQDNYLTGSTPYAFYPRLTASPGSPIPFGLTITPQELPPVYTPSGSPIFASGNSKKVPGNTLMDVLRFERDLAALSPNHQIVPLTISGIAPNFQNGYIGTWTTGVEQKIAGATLTAAYVGTAGVKLPVTDYPNAYPGASPQYAPYTQFDSSGQIIGGYGPINLMTNRSHSTYHSLQVSAQKDLTASGLGFQASYTLSKSMDDTSAVFGGFISGYSGAVVQVAPQNPFDTRADKAVSNFDIKNVLAFSLFQDLHADRAPFLRMFSKKFTAGWQLLGIGTFMSGLPFTVYSGVQQTGVGAQGTDRPDEIAKPDLSTSRTVREDYFGMGVDNTKFFSIPAGRFGTLGRNTFRGPGLHNFDMALIKDTPLLTNAQGEVASLQFRAEFFNVFNFVNFGLPSNIVLGPGFGEITRTAGTSRQIQFSLKVIY